MRRENERETALIKENLITSDGMNDEAIKKIIKIRERS